MSATIIAHSINPDGQEIITFYLTKVSDRMLLDLRTHRVLDFLWESESWSVASSRLADGHNTIAKIRANPLSPCPDGEWYGPAERAKMGYSTLPPVRRHMLAIEWEIACEEACDRADRLRSLGAHPEIWMAPLRPYMSYSAIVTGTDYGGFFAQRSAPDDGSSGPRREVRLLANEMRSALDTSVPVQRDWGDYHLPFVADDERGDLDRAIRLSASRCARATMDRAGEGDDRLADWLLRQTPPHWGPFEHPARAERGRWANLTGWRSERCRQA